MYDLIMGVGFDGTHAVRMLFPVSIPLAQFLYMHPSSAALLSSLYNSMHPRQIELHSSVCRKETSGSRRL